MNISVQKSLRLHIALLGRVNAGKSSFLNLVAGQNVSITSAVAGTTTDVVEKAQELKFSSEFDEKLYELINYINKKENRTKEYNNNIKEIKIPVITLKYHTHPHEHSHNNTDVSEHEHNHYHTHEEMHEKGIEHTHQESDFNE